MNVENGAVERRRSRRKILKGAEVSVIRIYYKLVYNCQRES